jgi:hypothetical protein
MNTQDTPATRNIYYTWLERNGGYAKDETLRDKLAGMAMQALLAHSSLYRDEDRYVTERAYSIADAMLKERI